MQIQVDASDANKKLTEVDRNLTSIRSTSSETSSSLKRMEGTFARIEKTMRSVERTMKGVHRIMKYMAKANVAMGNSFKGLGKDISDINSKFNKFSSNISNISSKYATLQKQNRKLAGDVAALKQQLKDLKGASGGAADAAKKTGGAFERLTKVLKENSYWVGSLVGGFLSLISIDLVSHFVRITDQLTLMKNRLGTVNPEVVKLRENFDTVVQIAMETRSNLAAVANLYSRIGRNSQRLQKDQEALARVVRTINQGFQLSGATAEEARNAIVQLSQAFASGRLQGDELRSVLELAPEAAKGLAKAIGITTGTMRRFAAEGMITTEVMVAAFEKASAETQAKFDNIKATISQAMENVRTAIYAGIEGAEEFGNANQLIANKIMSLANMIKNAKDQFSFIGKIVENVALNFEKFAVGIVAVVGVLGGMIIVSSLTALFSSFGAVIGLSAGAVAGLVTILGLLAYRLIDLNLEIKTTAEQLRPLDEVIKELSDSTKTGMDRLNGYREELANTKLASNELEVQLSVINRKINELSQSVMNARGTWREYADDLLGFIQEYKIFGLDLVLPGSDKQELAALTERAAKLEKLQMDMTERTAKLREQEKKAMEEVKKDAKEVDPQALLLKEVYAKQAAFARQMELVGEALSNEFIQGFTNPFDSGLGGIQSALTRFTENVASKTASLFKSKLPEGIPLFDPKVLVKQASSFNQAIEEGLRSGKRVSLFGMPDENGIRQLTQEYKDVITSILGDPSTQAAFKEQDTLGKIMQAEMDSILREQLIDLEKAINQYIIQQNQKIKTEERSLKAQREQLELTEFSAKAEMDGLKKNTPLLKVQESIIEEEYRIRLLNYEQKLKDLNITGQAKNALMEELALQKDLAISLEKVNQEKKLYLELQGKQRDLVSATERVADLQLELDHLIKGTSELEKQKSLNETIIAREKVILDQRREREGLTDEQYRQELAILETKKSLLDLETDITEEIRKQNELRKTEDELARARLLDQAKTQAQQMKGGLSLFQQLGIGLGLVKDPTKDFVDRQEAFIDATIASGKKVSDLYMGRGGTGLQINPAVQRDMDETAMNIIKNRMELFEEKSKTTPLNNNLATRLLGQSKFAPQEMEYALQRKKGGMLTGPSHASGGIKGMLYGQAIELEGGEYVINKDAVAKYGIPMFNALNTMRFAPGGVLPGTELTPQEAMRIANNLRTAGKLKEAKKFSDAVAEDYARRGVPTFRADGTVIGDPKKMLQKGDTTKAVEEVTEGFVKMAPAIEEVTKESKKVEKEFTKTNEAIGYAGSSWKEIETLSQKEIDAIESVTSRRMTAEEEAAYAIKKVTETYRDSARDWKEAYAEAEMRMGPQTGLLGDGMMGQTAAGIGAVFSDALGKSGAFKGFLEDIVMLTTNPVAGVTQILSKSLLQNERFQQALQRFLDIFYVLFDEVAEGLAIFFEAIVDMLAPLKPLMEMIGGSLREIMRAFTKIIQPFARLIEGMQPILIYLSAFLQIVVGLFSSILGAIGDVFDNFFKEFLNFFGVTTTDKYKSLNLLRQERDIISDINTSIGGLADTLEDINDVIFDIMNSALNISAPGTKLELAADKYNELYLAATSFGADDEAVTEFQNFAKTYLQQAQDVLKTSNAYQQIYLQVIEDLESLQSTMADKLGAEITESLKKGIFELEVAGSDLGGNIADVVQKFRDGILSYNDLLTYIGYKLAQTEEDISFKEFSEFGSIGSLDKVEQAYTEFRGMEFDRFNQAMGDAINSSSVTEDLKNLFGIGATGERIEGVTALAESEMVVAKEEGRLNALLRTQPTIGDVSGAEVPEEARGGDDASMPSFGANLDFIKLIEGLAQAIFDALLGALETVFMQVEKFLKALFSFIEKLGITIVKFLESLWDAIFGDDTIKALEGLAEFFTNIFDGTGLVDAIGGLGEFFTNIFDGSDLLDSVSGLGEFFMNILKGGDLLDAFGGLTEFFKNIFEGGGLLSSVQGLTDFFKNIFKGGDLLSSFQGLADFFTNIFKGGDLLDAVQGLVKFFENIISEINLLKPLEALSEFFLNIFKGGGLLDAGQVLSRLFNQIFGTSTTDALGAIGKFIEETIGGGTVEPINAIGKFFEEVVNGTMDAVNVFVKMFEEIISGVASGGEVILKFFENALRNVGDILMFKNPFEQFGIGPEYLLRFSAGGSVEKYADGGMLRGPSHDKGGIPAIVGGKKSVELEGGEFIIKKDTVDFIGAGFLSELNSYPESLDPNRYNSVIKFASGGEVDTAEAAAGIGKMMSPAKKVSGDLGEYLGGLAGSAKKSVGQMFSQTGPSVKNNNGKGKFLPEDDPQRLLDPSQGLPGVDLFSVDWQTSDWIENFIGEHKFKIDLNFPKNNVFEVYEEGGKIDNKYNDTNFNNTPSTLIDTGIYKDNLTKTFDVKMEDKNEDFVKNNLGIGGDFGGFMQSILDTGYDLIKGTLDIFGSFGGSITNNLTSFVPKGLLEIEADQAKFSASNLEFIVAFLSFYSLMSYAIEQFTGKSIFGEATTLGGLGYKGFGESVPIGILGALLAANIFDPGKDGDKGGLGNTGFLSMSGVKERYSLLDMIEYFGFDSEVGLFNQSATALTSSGVSPGGARDLLFATMTAMAAFLLLPNNNFSELENKTFSGFSKGGMVPSYGNGGDLASAGGVASGPLHQSGMLGVTRSGSPFLFEGGEYIVNRKAVDSIGVSNLDRLNQMGSGGMLPEFGDGTPSFWSKGYRNTTERDIDISGGITDWFVGIWNDTSKYLSGKENSTKGLSLSGAAKGLGYFLSGLLILNEAIPPEKRPLRFPGTGGSGSIKFPFMGSGGMLPEFEERGFVPANMNWANSLVASNPSGGSSRSSGFGFIETILALIFAAVAIPEILKALFPDSDKDSSSSKATDPISPDFPAPDIPKAPSIEDLATKFAGLQRYKLDPETQFKLAQGKGGGVSGLAGSFVENLKYVVSSTPFDSEILVDGYDQLISDFYNETTGSPAISSLAIAPDLFVLPESYIPRSYSPGSIGSTFFSNEIRNQRVPIAAASKIATYLNDTSIESGFSNVFDPNSIGQESREYQTKRFVENVSDNTGFIVLNGYRPVVGSTEGERWANNFRYYGKTSPSNLYGFSVNSPFDDFGIENYISFRMKEEPEIFASGGLVSMGSGGALPEFGEQGFLDSILGKSRRSKAFDTGKFEASAMGDVSRSRVIRGRGKRDNSFGFMDYLLSGLGIGGFIAIMMNNPNLFKNMGSGGALPEFGDRGHVGRGVYKKGGAGFSYDDIGGFFSMLASPFVSVYEFFASLFESKPRRSGFPRFGEKGTGGILPEHGTGVYKEGGAGFSYEDIGNFFSMLASPFVSVYEFFASLFSSDSKGKKRKYGFPRFGEKGIGGTIPEFGEGGGAGFSYEDIGNFFSMLASPFIAIYDFFAEMDIPFPSRFPGGKRPVGFKRFGSGGALPEAGKGGDLAAILGLLFLLQTGMSYAGSRRTQMTGSYRPGDSSFFSDFLMAGIPAGIFGYNVGLSFGSGGSLQSGGMAKGPSHQSGMIGYAQGGGPFLFEGGEYIVNKRATDKIGQRNLDMINQGKMPGFAEGGPLYGRRDLVYTTTGEDGGTSLGYSSAFGGGGASAEAIYAAMSKALLEGVVILGYEQIAFQQKVAAHAMALSMFMSGGTIEEQIAMAILPGLVQAGIYEGIIATGGTESAASAGGAAAGGIVTAGLLARGQAEEGREDIAFFTAIAAGVATAIFAGPAAAALAALMIGMYFGDMDRYMADFNADDLTEPFEGIVEEFMELESVGVPNFVGDLGSKFEDIGLRLSEAFSNFDQYLSETMFSGMGTGVKDTIGALFSRLEEFLKEVLMFLEGFIADPLGTAMEIGEAFITKPIDHFIDQIDGGFVQQLPSLVVKALSDLLTTYITKPIDLLVSQVDGGVLTNIPILALEAVFKIGEMYVTKPLEALIAAIVNFPEALKESAATIPGELVNLFLLAPLNALLGAFSFSFAGLAGGFLPVVGKLANILGKSELLPFSVNPVEGGEPKIFELASGFTPPSFQRGGYAVGPSHKNGGIPGVVNGSPIEFEGGEYIINKKTVDLLGANLFDRINSIKSISELDSAFSRDSLQVAQDGLQVQDQNLFQKTAKVGGTAGEVLKRLIGMNGVSLTGNLINGLSAGFGKYDNGGVVDKLFGNFNLFGINERIGAGLARDVGLGKFMENGGEVPKYFFGGSVGKIFRRILRFVTPNVKAGMNLDLANMSLSPYASIGYENGGFVSSGSNNGLGFSNNMAFVSILSEKSSMNNQLLSRLIEVVEEKEMSVTVVDSSGEERSSSNIRISRQREMDYRGARVLA